MQNSLSLHQPFSSLNQNIFIILMCLIHRILTAWRKHIYFGYKLAFGLVSGAEIRKDNPAFGTFPLFQVYPALYLPVLA